MVVQDTFTSVSQSIRLSDAQYEVQQKLVDSHYETIFKKFDPTGQDKIEQQNFYPLFTELLQIYNDHIDKSKQHSAIAAPLG